jgi:predicted enzyme related to lactoylglutathione lyase
MSRPTHFELPVDDPDRAEAFYRDVFGWSFHLFEGAPSYYGMADTGDTNPGINGALYQRRPGSGTAITMSVDDVDAAVKLIVEKGGALESAKAAVPGMGWFAVCKDTEGNTIGVFANDPTAAM